MFKNKVLWVGVFVVSFSGSISKQCQSQLTVADSQLQSPMHRDSFSLVFDYNWKLVRDSVEPVSGTRTVELERENSGRLHEMAYDIPQKASTEITEVFFDGVRHLYLSKQSDNYEMVLFLAPNTYHVYGLRAGGLALLTGISHHHSEDQADWIDVFNKSCTEKPGQQDESTLVSDTDLGEFSVSYQKSDGRVTEIKIEIAEDDFYCGKKLKEWQHSKLEIKLSGFVSEVTDQNPTGIKGFRYEKRSTDSKGKTTDIVCDVSIKTFENDSELPDTFDFVTEIPDGTNVNVLEDVGVKYIWSDGKLIKDIDKEAVETLLKASDSMPSGFPLQKWEVENGASICGIRCLFFLFNSNGIGLGFDQLYDPKYVSKHYGSTVKDLVLACKDNGQAVEVFSDLTPLELLSLRQPSVLYVRSRDGLLKANHWVVLIGFENGKFKIMDPSYGIELVDPPSLFARFDGTALILAKNDWQLKRQSRHLSFTRMSFAFAFMLCLAISSFGINFVNNRHKWRIFSSLCLFILFPGLGLAFHSLSPTGLLAEKSSYASRLATVEGISFEVIDKPQLKEMLRNGDNIGLVDARYNKSFSYGSIPGAVNYPLDASAQVEEEVFKALSETKCQIVFCQSKNCSYKERIARKLYFNGFTNVKIYADGWRDWRSNSTID